MSHYDPLTKTVRTIRSAKLVTAAQTLAVVSFASCSTLPFALQPSLGSDQKHPDMRLFFQSLSPDDAVATYFERFDIEGFVADSNGGRWMVSEDDLTLVGDRIEPLVRLPSQRAFWFGWYAQFPNTRLVH
jgi:hypothetical protein